MGNGMRWELRMWSPSLAEIHLPRGILCCQVWPCVSPCTLWGYCWHTCKDTTVTRHWEHTHHLCFLIESSKFFYKVYVYAIVFFWLKWNSKPNIGQCVKKQELLHTACKNLHCYKHFGKYIYQQLGLKMWISYDPPIPYLGIYSKRDFCTCISGYMDKIRSWKHCCNRKKKNVNNPNVYLLKNG